MVLLLMITLAFANHLMPGFDNLNVLNAISISPASYPYSMYLNFDKTIVAVILVIASSLLLKTTPAFGMRTLTIIIIMTTLCIAVLIPLAVWSGFIAFDPKFPTIFWLWAFNNLLFVCFAEEVIFRGVIQNYLMKIANQRQWPSFIPIFITAILFGLVLLGHVKGGIAYIGFVMIAGLFYGYVYYQTQRLEAAILTHFGVNACHFLLFTYPAAL
jgi:membrane protease YdiL (CAAX protease family)